MPKIQLTSSSLTQTTQLQKTTYVTKTHLQLLTHQKQWQNYQWSAPEHQLCHLKGSDLHTKEKNNSKKLSQGAINELETTHKGASSLIALVNQRHQTNVQELEEMHEHLQKKAEMTENKQKRTCLNLQSSELDSNSAFVDESESESD